MTQTQAESQVPGLSDNESHELAPYGRVSRCAVVALALGGLSVTAFISPVLWFVPLAAVVTAALALWNIAVRPELIGRKAALLGLALAVLLGSWATTRSITRQWVLYGQAQQYADAWLELVQQGQMYQAHQLHLPDEERRAPSVPLEQFYADSAEMRKRMDWFFAVPALQQSRQLGERGRWHLEGYESLQREKHQGDLIKLRYRLEYQEKGRPKSQAMLLSLRRYPPNSSGQCDWRMEGARDLAPSGP